MRELKILCLIAVVSFASCSTSKSSASRKGNSDKLNKEAAVMWQQTAAEYDALCYQAFNLAKMRISSIGNDQGAVKGVIIMDLDETVLDNSAYNGYLIKNNLDFTEESWDKWVRKVEATLVPGAKEFIDFANKSGHKIIYISNRKMNNLEHTVRNMAKLEVMVDPNLLFLRPEGTKGKSSRRNGASSMGDVILFIGDNLADFSDDFEQELSHLERNKIVDGMRSRFGTYFIMLPNPMYGDWEKALKYNDPLIKDDEKGGKLKYMKSFE